MQKATPQQIVAHVVPEEYLLGDQALYLFAYDKVKDSVSRKDGLISRCRREGDAARCSPPSIPKSSRTEIELARPTPTSS